MVTTQDSVTDFDEEATYAAALSELKSGTARPGLWAKAFAGSDGDENKSQALYIRLRVQNERERKQREQYAANALAAEPARRRAEEFLAVISQLQLKGYEAKKAGDGWTVREPLGGRVKLQSDKSLLEYAEGRVTILSKKVDIPEIQVASPSSKESERDRDFGTQPTGVHISKSVPVSPKIPAADVVGEEKKRPSGVGGWLFLLVAGMLVLGPLLGAGRINADIMTAENQYPALKSLPQWANFRILTWWTFLAIAALSIYGGWGLARGKDWSVVKRARIVLWVAGPVGALILGVIVPLVTLRESNVGDAQFVGSLMASIIAAGIWTTYLSKSKRVRNTYGPPT